MTWIEPYAICCICKVKGTEIKIFIAIFSSGKVKPIKTHQTRGHLNYYKVTIKSPLNLTR